MGDQIPTIYDWAGGRPAFERWLGHFYDLVEQDELLAPLFGGKVSDQHRRDVVTWWCEVMGGPPTYTEALGGYEHMLSKHRGLHITGEQCLHFVTLLSRAADEVALRDNPEFRAAVMGYAEWGTRLAVHNSSGADDIVEHAPVPRWVGVWHRLIKAQANRWLTVNPVYGQKVVGCPNLTQEEVDHAEGRALRDPG